MRSCVRAYVGHDMFLFCVRWDMASLYGVRQSEERLQERGGRGVGHPWLGAAGGAAPRVVRGAACALCMVRATAGMVRSPHGAGRVCTVATSLDSASAERPQRPVSRAARAGPLPQRSPSTLTTVVWDTRVTLDLDVARPTVAPRGQRPALLGILECDALLCVTVTIRCPSPAAMGRGLTLSSFS